MAILSTKNLRRAGMPTVTGRLSKAGFKVWFIPILVIVLGTIGWWTRSEIEATLKARMSENLETIRDADIAALEFWLEGHRAAAAVLADRTVVKQLTEELVSAANSSNIDRDILLQSPAKEQMREFLAPPMEDYGYLGFALVDRAGMVITAKYDQPIGAGLDADLLPRVIRSLGGEVLIAPPFRTEVEVDDNPDLQPGDVIMFSMAPVFDGEGSVLAVLGFVLDINEFSDILHIAQPGDTGETYAFNADGILLSNSRFEPELREIGLLPEDESVDSVLNVDIRNPGGDMTAGFVPTTNRRAQPLTLAAAAAAGGETGVNIDGYPDYRGVQVVGAWRWLDRYGFGVVSEQDYEEAYSALNRLRTIQMVLLGLLIAAGAAMVLESVVISRLGKKVTEAVIEARQLGQYTLDKKIGAGGMGEVYRASHALLQRPTAVKLLRPDKAGETDIARFEREVQLTAQLTHPNTIAIYDFGRTPDNVFYYAMEYLNGINLQDLVDQTGPQEPARVIYVLQQACGSLSEAHGINLIHRDIKPANIILCDRGGTFDVVKVVDFGIVKDIGSNIDTQLTQAGAFSGTPLYIAPETIRATEEVDARVDVYALGAVGYFLLTGQPIFPEDLSGVDILTRQLGEMPPRPSSIVEVSVPTDLEQLIMRCLAKEPDERPSSTAEMLDLLTELADAGRWGSREAKRWWALHGELAGFSTSGGDTADQSQTHKTIAVAVHGRGEEEAAS